MSPEAKSVVTIDTLATTPEFAAVRDALAAESWPQLEAALASLPADQASIALLQLAGVPGIESLLESADSTWARTALGVRYTVIAWEARSGKAAKHVSREQLTGFFEWLGKADEILLEVVEKNPDFSPAWTASLTTARGLQLGKDELLRRYGHVSPTTYSAQTQALIFLLPKWFGSWEEAREFVDGAIAAAPAGSTSHALVALLHVEIWSGTDSIKETLKHLDDPQVLADLRAASAAFLSGGAPLDPARVEAHSAFAMMFSLGQHFDDAAVHFRALGSRASEFPWRYQTDSERKLTKIRDAALKKAR